MAEVRPLRNGIDVPERVTPGYIVEAIDHLRSEAEAGVITALALAYIQDGVPMHVYCHEAGEDAALAGEAHALAHEITHARVFPEDE